MKGRGVGGHREEEERDGSETDLKKIKKICFKGALRSFGEEILIRRGRSSLTDVVFLTE